MITLCIQMSPYQSPVYLPTYVASPIREEGIEGGRASCSLESIEYLPTYVASPNKTSHIGGTIGVSRKVYSLSPALWQVNASLIGGGTIGVFPEGGTHDGHQASKGRRKAVSVCIRGAIR